MLDCKKLTYSAFKKCLMVKNGNTAIIIDHLNTYNLYYVNISDNVLITIPSTYAITAATSLLPTDITI